MKRLLAALVGAGWLALALFDAATDEFAETEAMDEIG
jgi:Mg2+ and Co2+ transporter CorA